MPRSEASLVQSICHAVKRHYPLCYIRKLADRNSRGLPDLIILFRRRPEFVDGAGTLWVETKTDHGRLSAIQEQEHRLIERAGGVVVVARDVATVLEILEEMGVQP